MPLVGEIAAAGLSTRQLEDEIERRLKADDFLVSSQVGVQLAADPWWFPHRAESRHGG